MGGRLDATNTLNPEVSVITNISKDHTKSLGNSIEKIATEKACIIKKNTPIVIGKLIPRAKNIIQQFADNKSASVIDIADHISAKFIGLEKQFMKVTFGERFKEQSLGLLGKYQIENASMSIMVADILANKGFSKISDKTISAGLQNVKWKGRFHIINASNNPHQNCSDSLIIIDAAHNLDGMTLFIDSLQVFFSNKKILFLIGILEDKEYFRMIKYASKLSKHFVFTMPEINRATPIAEYKKVSNELGLSADFIPDVTDAYKVALEKLKDFDILCACGSLYTIGKIYEFIGLEKK